MVTIRTPGTVQELAASHRPAPAASVNIGRESSVSVRKMPKSATPRRHAARPGDVLRGAMSLELHSRKGIAPALFDQPDGQMGHVNANPLPPLFCAAWTEVPLPQNGSSTISPGLEEALRILSGAMDQLENRS